jgi:hypothetical protein
MEPNNKMGKKKPTKKGLMSGLTIGILSKREREKERERKENL